VAVPPSPRTRALILGVLLVVGTAACSDDDDRGQAEAQPAPTEVVDVGSGPDVEIPEGQAPPSGLVVEDLVEGDGEPVEQGAVLTVQYVGLTWSGSEFTSSWERGQALTYQHGDGRWIEGWTAGLEGMREGGQRRLVVPPELAYGQRGAPGIPPGETLVFVLDLLDVG
jgi:peptidylprolyl isomerase